MWVIWKIFVCPELHLSRQSKTVFILKSITSLHIQQHLHSIKTNYNLACIFSALFNTPICSRKLFKALMYSLGYFCMCPTCGEFSKHFQNTYKPNVLQSSIPQESPQNYILPFPCSPNFLSLLYWNLLLQLDRFCLTLRELELLLSSCGTFDYLVYSGK